MTGQPLSNLKGETTRVGVEGENLSEVIGGIHMETTGDHRPEETEEKLTEKIEGVHTEEMGGILSADIGRILLEKSSLNLKKEENLLEAEGIEGSPVAVTEAVPMAAMAGEHHFEVIVIPLLKKTPDILVEKERANPGDAQVTGPGLQVLETVLEILEDGHL